MMILDLKQTKDSLFLICMLFILLLRILANIDYFNYEISVVAPLILIPISSLLIIRLRHSNFIKRDTFLFILVIFFLIFIPLLQRIALYNVIDSIGRSTYEYITVISALAITWLLVGATISNFRSVNKYIVIIFFLISLFAFYEGLNGGYFVDYYNLTVIRSDDIKIHHLSLTEPLTYIIFLTLSVFYNSKIKWFIIFLSVYIMLALGGRVSFFCFIFTLLFYEFLISGKLLYVCKLLISMILFFLLVGFIASNLDDNFAYEKLFFNKGIGEDESFQSRVEFLQDFFDGFLSQLVIGNPNYLVYKHNDLGTYAHNLLSLYQFYGIFSFILVCFIIIRIIWKIYNLDLYKNINPLYIFGTTLFIYSILSLIIGKSISFSPFWFILGFWLFVPDIKKERSYV